MIETIGNYYLASSFGVISNATKPQPWLSFLAKFSLYLIVKRDIDSLFRRERLD